LTFRYLSKGILQKDLQVYLSPDIEKVHANGYLKIQGKTVLVIGGAGTIGSSYIKAVFLAFKPAKLVVVIPTKMD
jgi:FlaA1/EpsC-like NDP-sugar epimerase